MCAVKLDLHPSALCAGMVGRVARQTRPNAGRLLFLVVIKVLASAPVDLLITLLLSMESHFPQCAIPC